MPNLFARTLLAVSLFSSVTAIAQPHFAAPPPRATPHRPAPVEQPVAPAIDPVEDPGADILVVANRATVRTALVQARATNLDAFIAYQNTGTFPSNTFKDKSLNVWRDRDGHFCAAATIIRASGATALVDQVAKDSNFIKLGDVKSGALMDWMLTSGFTQQEIAAIQEPFMPVYHEQPVVQQPLRTAEDQRLMARYQVVTAQLVREQLKSIDIATERLMANPALAQQFVNAHSVDD